MMWVSSSAWIGWLEWISWVVEKEGIRISPHGDNSMAACSGSVSKVPSDQAEAGQESELNPMAGCGSQAMTVRGHDDERGTSYE